MSHTNSLVSIVIPSYNEATYIDRLLDCLEAQTYSPLEIIVSDAGTKDGIDTVVDSYKSKLNISLVTSPPEGPAQGRNVGAKYANGDWLLFLDSDDVIKDPNFIMKLVETSEKNGWQTSSSKITANEANLLERAGTRTNYLYTTLLAHTKHPVAPGWCILTRRSLFEENSGFNAKIQLGEDYDYVTRVGKHGFGFVNEAECFIDLRRVREEGWHFIRKGILNEVYRHTHHYNLEKNPYKYEFGGHKKRK